MFCDACGSQLQAGQTFCSRCGKEIRGGMSIVYPRSSRVREHVRLLGILWLAYSAVHVFGGLVLFVIANTVFLHVDELGGPPVPARFLHLLLSSIAILVLAKSAAGFAAGWGLLQRLPWARVLSLIVAFLALFSIPLGTALGVYTLWVLLPSQSDQEYREQARAA